MISMKQAAKQLSQQRRRNLVVVALAAIVALPSVFTRPNPPALSTLVTGNAALAERVRPHLPGALDRVSIAVIDGATVTYAHFGANEHTEYEIGSLTKTFTAALLADAIRRGEVTADTKIGTLLPLDNTPVADVTLAELASHRAGLSAQGMHLVDTLLFAVRCFRHRNPFLHDVDGVLAIARKATLTQRGGFVYSNLGVALLGQGLASAAQMDYPRLLQERLFMPLGMKESSLPLTVANLPNNATTGYSAAGIAEAPWAINGWAPAGGVRSTPADLVRYVQALLAGATPGMDALTPRWQFDQLHIGYAWLTQEVQGHQITYTNGLTGGFTSKIMLDRTQQRAVIILSNTAAQVDEAAKSLLIGAEAWVVSP